MSLKQTRVSHVEDPLQDSSAQKHHLLSQLQQKQDDLDNRMRRNNLHFIVRAEGANLALFLKDLLINAYGRETFSKSYVVERAHRMVPKPPPQGAPPSAFITKFLNY